jgi:hypothetical protein
MSEAISSQDTKLYVDLTGVSPAVYVLIPEVKSISGPSEKAEKTDVTHLNSPGRRREYIQSYLTSDDCTVVMNYVPGDATQAAFLALYDSGDIVSAKILYPDLSYNIFDMFVVGRSRPVSVGTAIEITAVMSITGDVNFTGS